MNVWKKCFIVILLVLGLSACEGIAIQMTAKKKPAYSHSALAQTAENTFWEVLHSGDYNRINTAVTLLMAAYLANPNDPVLAAHLGFMHIWKITERARLKKIPPTIVDEVVLAKHYFADAVTLNSYDARTLGFLGDTELIAGDIFKNEREKVRGYFTLQAAIHRWPEFNYFTAGYPMSNLARETPYFKEALDWQWRTLDLCAGQKIKRSSPDFSPFMHRATKIGPQRACWNSWIAPFNFEGFFLNMGDMLVKSGDWMTAIAIYKNAKLDPKYSSWPFKPLLENRIAHAQENVVHFQKSFISPEKTLVFNSGYGCMVCHQQKNKLRIIF